MLSAFIALIICALYFKSVFISDVADFLNLFREYFLFLSVTVEDPRVILKTLPPEYMCLSSQEGG